MRWQTKHGDKRVQHNGRMAIISDLKRKGKPLSTGNRFDLKLRDRNGHWTHKGYGKLELAVKAAELELQHG